MTPQEGFESAQFLVAWAKSQFDELETLINTFVNSNPATVVKEFNSKRGLYEAKVRFEPLPPRIRGLANNIIKDLRDALDQATHAASFLITGKPGRQTHFPFGNSPDDFDTAITKNLCKGIPVELYPILRGFQPYPTGDAWNGGDNFLRLLGRVSGPHKHRITVAQTINRQGFGLGNIDLRFGPGAFSLGPEGKAAKNNELVFMAFGENSHFKFDLHMTFYVGFSGPKMEGISVLDFLLACITSVGKIVQNLEAESSRIGPRR